jgi:hypothetical protein
LKFRHGLCRSLVYRRWSAMIDRCDRSGCKQYKDYGGRGIRVCAGFRVFDNFFAAIGHPPAGQVLDRENNDGQYSCGHCAECTANGWPANVRWVTRIVSARNSRSKSAITVGGVTRSLIEWSEETGLGWGTIQSRVARHKPSSDYLNPNHLRWGTPLRRNQ